MTQHEITVEVSVIIATTDEGEQGMRRFVDLSPEAAEEMGVRPGMSFEDIKLWLASALITAGRSNASQDGFADLAPDAISVRVDDVREY